MGHQGQEGWYPECELCHCGKLSRVVCWECHQDAIKQKDDEITKLVRKFGSK